MCASIRIKRSNVNIALAIIGLWLYIFRVNNGVTRTRSKANVSLCSTTVSYHDVSCHCIELDDDLPPIQNHRFQSTKKHIYFYETTCNGLIDPRQACVVESAARLHPDWQINLVFSAPMNISSRAELKHFQEFSNVKFWRVNILRFFNNTPLEYLVTKRYLEKSCYAVSHTSDVLRTATLYNWDGVYLDLDALLIKPLDSLAQNFAPRENDYYVSNSILALSSDKVGRSVAKELFREVSATFEGRIFNHNGPGAMTRVLQRRCNTTDASRMSQLTCSGFQVYGPSYFYPIHWSEGHKFFEPDNLLNDFPYGYHFWNERTKHLKVSNSSTFVRLARKYCSFTYQLFKEKFGFTNEQI